MMWNVPGQEVDPARFNALQPVKVLYDFEGPKTFTFRDQDGELCLAHWWDEDDGATRYTAVAFSSRLLAKLEQRLISVRDAVEQPRAWVLDEDAAGNVRTAWRVEIADLPEDVLPKPGTPLSPALERTRSVSEAI